MQSKTHNVLQLRKCPQFLSLSEILYFSIEIEVSFLNENRCLARAIIELALLSIHVIQLFPSWKRDPIEMLTLAPSVCSLLATLCTQHQLSTVVVVR